MGHFPIVAVGVAEIGGVTHHTVFVRLPARSRFAFIATAIGERDVVKPLDLVAVLGLQRDHGAITDAGFLPVERLGRCDPGAAVRLAPSDEGVELHHSPNAHFGGDGIVELRGALEVVGPEGDVSDHGSAP